MRSPCRAASLTRGLVLLLVFSGGACQTSLGPRVPLGEPKRDPDDTREAFRVERRGEPTVDSPYVVWKVLRSVEANQALKQEYRQDRVRQLSNAPPVVLLKAVTLPLGLALHLVTFGWWNYQTIAHARSRDDVRTVETIPPELWLLAGEWKPAPGIPVRIEWSAGDVRHEDAVSDGEGLVRFDLRRLRDEIYGADLPVDWRLVMNAIVDERAVRVVKIERADLVRMVPPR